MGMDRVIKKKKNPLRLFIGGGIVAALLLVFSYQLLIIDKRPIQTTKKSEMRFSAAKKGEFQEYFQANCYVASVRSMFIDSQESGTVQTVGVEQGDIVLKGQILIKLQNNELESMLSLKKSALDGATTDLENNATLLEQMETRNRQQVFELDHQIGLAKDEKDRRESLFECGALPERELAKARKELDFLMEKRSILAKSNELDLTLLKHEGEKIRHSMDIMSLDLQRIEDRIRSLAIVSPAYGQITSFSASVGELKTIGSRIAQLDIMDRLKMKANLDEYYLPKLAVGTKGSFIYLGSDGKDIECELKLSWISPDVKSNSFEVDFGFGAMPMNIRIGQRFLVRVELGKKREALMLEDGPFSRSSGGNWAYVVDPSGATATKRDIVVGKSNPEYLEVLKGLDPGEKVVISDYSGFHGLDRISIK
jgi:HlyD family secretion protein